MREHVIQWLLACTRGYTHAGHTLLTSAHWELIADILEAHGSLQDMLCLAQDITATVSSGQHDLLSAIIKSCTLLASPLLLLTPSAAVALYAAAARVLTSKTATADTLAQLAELYTSCPAVQTKNSRIDLHVAQASCRAGQSVQGSTWPGFLEEPEAAAAQDGFAQHVRSDDNLAKLVADTIDVLKGSNDDFADRLAGAFCGAVCLCVVMM